MKNVKLKAMVLGICIAVVATMSVAVIAETSSDDQLAGTGPTPYVGNVCFTFDDFTDTWIWSVDRVGNGIQVTGFDAVYPAAMDGGGVIIDNHLLLAVTETQTPPGGRRCIHAIDIDMSTWTGIDSFSWHYPDGTAHTTHMGIGLRRIPCPAPGEVIEGLTSDSVE